MVDPISPDRLMPASPVRPNAAPGQPDKAAGGNDFAAELRQQLEQVSRMQAEADEGVQNLLTGRTDNITGVLTTARKAEVAFSLLMEIRNKLVDAYSELKQLRV
jgi:flagellar hook-basal body complex protein FliE